MGRGQYIQTGKDSAKNTWLIFTPDREDGSGVLADVLDTFKVRIARFMIIIKQIWIEILEYILRQLWVYVGSMIAF